MKRKDKRELMNQALKEITVPFLREQGFKGSLPHFRRVKGDRMNLLTIQHSMSDERFVVEIANCPVNGITTSWGLELKPSKCTAHHMWQRLRLGSVQHKTDYWFDYSKAPFLVNIYKKRAKEIIKLWEEAEKWWEEDPYGQRNPINYDVKQS